MKTNFLKSIFFGALIAGMVASCVNDDDYGIPAVDCTETDVTANATVEDVYDAASGTATLYNDDDIIEGYVVSSDRGGNFYKTLYLVSPDGTRGFNVQVNDVNLFNSYNVGRKVYIKMKGLYTQIRSNTLQIGALYNNNVGQIAESDYEAKIIRSCTNKQEAELVNAITVDQVNDSYLGKLVELTNVQFTTASLGQNYYNTANVDGGGQTLTYITDAAGTATIPFRTSSFAEYAGNPVSQNSGKIRGVLTKFNTTYQFVARFTSDIDLSNPRLGEGGGTCTEPATANKTVADIFNSATATATPYSGNDIIEGFVTSSDQGGNFFKMLYLVSGDGSKGFQVMLNKTALYNDYPVGKKVYVKLNGLHTQIRNNTLQIGGLFNGNVGQIEEASISQHILKGCEQKTEAQLLNNLTLATGVTDANLGKLVEFDLVQFTDAAVGKKYYDSANVIGGQTNYLLTDAQGNTVIFRTGSFAEYKDVVVVNNSGKVRGILTKFGTDYQFIARRTADINLTQARFTVTGGGGNPGNPGDPSPTAAFVFGGGNFENWSNFTAGINSFGLKSYATQGTGNGLNNSASLQIITTGATANDYVFTTVSYPGLPATASKIQFYVKGSSAKSLSFNVYKTDGTFYPFNLGDVTTAKTVTAAGNNQYTGTINTNGNWTLITLDLTGLTNLALTGTGNFFALKVGSNANYNLQLDNFTIE